MTFKDEKIYNGMKELVKRSGVIFIFIGVLLLGYSEFQKMESNQLLLISGGLIMFGFLLYVILNNIME